MMAENIVRKKVGVISLGCDKNRVDTEKALAILKTRFELVSDPEQAQIIMINTCAFLESSRKEAIEEILYAVSLKQSGSVEKIIVTGCLPQKFINEIFNELIEVDAFLGISDYSKILSVIERIYRGERVKEIGEPINEDCINRVLTTDGYAYLKIADGCNNHCTYCLIPKIRGKYRSIPKERLIEEAKNLGEVNELILVAQDLTRYGQDLENKSSLVQLIRELSALRNVLGIRLLYCYPESITDELIHEFSVNPKLIRYIDVPLQHADDSVLKRMGRKGTCADYLELIKKLRESVKGIAIRSTFITGFPGETEEAFNNLLNFLQMAKLDNAGFFKYSREKDTPAYLLDGQIKEGVKTLRLKKLYKDQKKISKQNNKDLRLNKSFKVLAEGFDYDQMIYYGRAYFNAPDVDGMIYFFSSEPVVYGEHVDVKITSVTAYDLYGERQ